MGEKVLVLLPTSTNKLLAQWQGSYEELVKKINKHKGTLQDKPGQTRATEHIIDTGAAKPVKLPPYRLPRVDKLIDRLGIRPSSYRHWILARGYWQVPMAAESSKKTAFVTPFGQFEFNVMPFGLQGAPSTFQRMMDQVLQWLGTWLAAFIDDVVVHGATWSKHVTTLAAVVTRLQEAGLTAKSMETFPVPKTKTDGRAFLGLMGYYIPEYATLAAPLTELTKKEQPIWSSECAEAFEALKQHLCTSPVLRCPDVERPFVLQTDASDWGVGAVPSGLL
eukprot:Em0006g997a